MDRLAKTITARFSFILLAAVLAGLLLPGLDRIPAQSVSLSLAIITFISFFQASWQDVRQVSPLRLVLFYLARFLILPVILYWLAGIVVPIFADSVLLLGLLPSGVMAVPVSIMLSGNVTINFILFGASNLVTPFALPALFELFAEGSLQIDTVDFFRNLLLLILVPFLVHLPFRRSTAVSAGIRQYGGAVSTILVSLIIVVAIGQSRGVIFQNPRLVVESIFISFLIYGLFHVSGWYLGLSGKREEKIAYSVASGVNQLGLGVSLAFLYFPPMFSIFMVSCNLAWVVTIALSKRIIGRGSP